MQKKEHIVRATADEARKLLVGGGDKTDWRRVKAMSQAEVEHLADEEEGPLPEDWEASIRLGTPEPKQDVHIRLDPVVLRWFKTQGPGYQTRINAVLRAFVDSKQRNEQRHRRS